MKKVFGLFLFLIVLMGLSACEAELPEDSKKPNPEEGEPFEVTLEYSSYEQGRRCALLFI